MKNKINSAIEYANRRYKPVDKRLLNKAEEVRINKIVNAAGSNKTILDIGCYDGTIGEKIINTGNIVYGIEISKEAGLIAEQRGVIVTSASVEDEFPYDDKFFDVVIAGEIIEHLLDTMHFLNEIKRIMKDTGILILTTPNVASLGRRIFLLFGKNPYFEAAYGFPPDADAGHIRFYTKGLLFDFMNFMGFEVKKYESTVINFGSTGKLSSAILAKIFPTLGACHFIIAVKK